MQLDGTVCWSVAKLLPFLLQFTKLLCLHGVITDGGALCRAAQVF